ncbi:MAG: TIGR00725 family protein [Firmicutes bacterium]|nr:TIGR00725 family protein [Bacillota bacterium]
MCVDGLAGPRIQECDALYYIGVIGSGECDTSSLRMAEEVGAEIARRGAILVCGGGGGVMEAASRGAGNAGGTAIGILSGDDHQEGNDCLTYAVATGMGEARNAIIARTIDGAIAIDGEYGTLSEIALTMKMGKPVVGIHTWNLDSPGGEERKIIHCDTPAEAIETLYRLLGECNR